jgi:hypothetical protein
MSGRISLGMADRLTEYFNQNLGSSIKVMFFRTR